MEAVGAMRPMVLCQRSADGRPRVVIACDDRSLRWLGASFKALGPRTPFHIGDLASDPDREWVIAVAVAPAAKAAMTPLEDAVLRWMLPVAQARRFADLIGGMADSRLPCHQYLETDPGLPVVIISKDEFAGRR